MKCQSRRKAGWRIRGIGCTEGAVSIDGVNIKDFDLRELRKNIAVLFQDFVQYDFTATENIRLGDVKNGSSSERIQEAARLSCADTVIAKLPQGYDTLLGKYFENGEELSMGQWQRIALARTLYADAQVLVLDEPTSWMDAEAKTHFYQQLEQIKKGRSCCWFSIIHLWKNFHYQKCSL